MTLTACFGGMISIVAGSVLFSCSNQHNSKMTKTESENITTEIKTFYQKLTQFSEKAELDPFINCYDSSAQFVHISCDGQMRNYEEFRKICADYYTTLKQQKITTITGKVNVIDAGHAIYAWTGNIVAEFKNGDIMRLNNYSITSIFKKIDGQWKIIHAHESSPPPEMIKKTHS